MMKKLLLATLLTASFSAQAADHKQCSAVSGIAGTIMDVKNSGALISDMMNIEDPKGLIRPIVIDAYEQPTYSTKKYIKKQTSEFKNKWYLKCIKG